MTVANIKLTLCSGNITYREYALMRFAAHRDAAIGWLSMGKIMQQPIYIKLARSEASLARSYYRRITNP